MVALEAGKNKQWPVAMAPLAMAWMRGKGAERGRVRGQTERKKRVGESLVHHN